MSELPEGWAETTIAEISSDALQRIPAHDETFSYIDISSIDRLTKRIVNPQRLAGASAPSRARKLVQTGDVLVSMTRPNLNAVALVPDELNGQIASTGFDVLRPLAVDPRFLYYLVRIDTFVNTMSELVQGALYPAIRPRDIRGFPIALPPAAEQKRIADKLEDLLARADTCRERLDRIPAILKKFRQTILESACSGKLTEEWRSQFGVDADAGIVSVGDVAESISYGTSAKSLSTGLVPVLRMGNIQQGKIDWSDLVYSSDSEEISKYNLLPNDILFNRTNSPELVGKTGIYKGERQAIYAGYLICIRCSRKIVPDYLNFCLNSPSAKEYCWQVKSDGVSQSNINAKKLAAFQILLPPLEEQAEIVRRVEALFALADRIEARLKIARTAVEKATPALLAKAFRGELVPQDPNDEPASVLLERIRAERASAGAEKPSRRKKDRTTRPKKAETHMLRRKDVPETHLSDILKARGRLTPNDLIDASDLDIDDFYAQLKSEEAKGLLKETRTGRQAEAGTLLEAV